MFRWRKFCSVFSLLLLSACSGTTFVYNQLDFILPWYVDDYAELNTQQDFYLDELIAPFLKWHRNQELPAYTEIIEGVEERLDQPLTAENVADVFAEMEAAWLRIEGKALDWLLDLGEQLSDEQVNGFLEVLWERQEEFEEKYLERKEEEFHEDSYDNLVDNMEDFLGTLTKEQRERLREYSSRLLRSDQAWLKERAGWLEELGVLLQREYGWQQRVVEAIERRRNSPAPEYLRIYQNNMDVIFEAVAELLNSRSEWQDQHLRETLSELREDIESLVCGVEPGC